MRRVKRIEKEITLTNSKKTVAFTKKWHIINSIYLFKVNNRNTRTRCEICSKLRIKTPERRH